MGKSETIFLRGKIKKSVKKPDKDPVKAGPPLISNPDTPKDSDFLSPGQVSPVRKHKPKRLARPFIVAPRLRRRFRTSSPGQVRRVLVPVEEPKKSSIFREEEPLPKGHRIIWGYNPWSGQYALGNSRERRQDRFHRLIRSLITHRSVRMREVQHALAVAAVVMVLLLGFGQRAVQASMNEIPVDDGAVRAVNVYCEGEYLGMVPSEESLRICLDDIEKELHDVYEMDVVVGSNLTYKTTVSSCLPENCLNETLRQVVDRLDVQVRASMIRVDGKVYGYLRNEAESRAVLDRILAEGKAAIETDAAVVEVVGFVENVEVCDQNIYYSELNTPEDVYAALTCIRDEKQLYTVQNGDTLWEIAERYAMSVEDIQALNPSMGDRLKVGNQIVVNQEDRVLDILTAETVVYDQEVPYQIVEEKRNNMYTTQSVLVRAGRPGIQRITARIYRCNGVEQSRDILKEESISAPVDRIIAVGTIEPALFVDNSRGDGRYIWPAQGRLTSVFGRRWGRSHNGLDIANLSGTPVYAADGGTVIYARRKSGYGNFIIIYHGDGRETCYGHLKDYAVGEGTAVKKGQLIGYMGNTGRSTGNHLHFEIRINGTPQNPLNFLN